MHEKTLAHIKEWYKRFFNHAGWTMLAAVKGHNEKRLMFISEAEKLEESIREKHKSVGSADLKRDLEIMANNVNKIKQVIKDHNMSMTEMANYKEVVGNIEPVTYHSLCRMYKGSFQKVGWALLGAAHGHSSKLNCLMNSFSYLHYCLDQTIDTFSDKDKKHELEIMDNHVRTMLSINYTKEKSRSSSPTKSVPSRSRQRPEITGSLPQQGNINKSPEISRRSAPTAMTSSSKLSKTPGSPVRSAGTGTLSNSINPMRPASPRGSRSRMSVPAAITN